MKFTSQFFCYTFILLLISSCASIRKSAIRSVADMLSSPDGTGSITSDDDPQLIADSLPLALKLYEILLDQDPENAELSAATGRNFVMYSGAFVSMPADRLDDVDWEEASHQRARAKKLYRRGRDYLLDALEIKHPGFLQTMEEGNYDQAMAELDEQDASTAYWAGLAWLGMASTDVFDLNLAASLDKAILLLFRSLELEESNADLHNVMIDVQLSLPSGMLLSMQERSPATAAFIDRFYEAKSVGQDAGKRAFYHYYRAVELSDGKNPSPHITMARSLSIKEQNEEDFKDYLNKALAIDPDENPDMRLMVLIYQEQARWLLENSEVFFL